MVIANTLTMVHHSRSPTRRWSNRSSETFAGGQMEDNDNVSDLDLEALERKALSQESTPDMPRQKQVAAPSATQGQSTLVIAAR